MSGTDFVPIIPGAVDDIGAACGLSWSARSLLRWLAETADRVTGELRPVTVYAIWVDTGCSRSAVRRALDELEAADLVKAYLPRGHDGAITVLCHDELVWQRGRSRGSGSRSRGSRGRSRGSRGRMHTSARANRGNDPQKKKTSRADDAAPSSEASSPAGAPRADGPSANGDTPERNDELNRRWLEDLRKRHPR